MSTQGLPNIYIDWHPGGGPDVYYTVNMSPGDTDTFGDYLNNRWKHTYTISGEFWIQKILPTTFEPMPSIQIAPDLTSYTYYDWVVYTVN